VNGVGKGAVAGGRFVYDTSTRGRRRRRQRLRLRRRGLGQAFRSMQTGKVQQYAAILFAAAAVLAGVFIDRHLAPPSPPQHRQTRRRTDMDFLNDWGLTAMVFLPLAGAPS
jgi:hypothetical protein